MHLFALFVFILSIPKHWRSKKHRWNLYDSFCTLEIINICYIISVLVHFILPWIFLAFFRGRPWIFFSFSGVHTLIAPHLDQADEHPFNMADIRLTRIKPGRQAIKTDQNLMRTFPTPPPSVNLSLRKDVTWAHDSEYYALRLTLNNGFKIKQAPVPELGSPWPMPQLYNPSDETYIVNPFTFKFH